MRSNYSHLVHLYNDLSHLQDDANDKSIESRIFRRLDRKHRNPLLQLVERILIDADFILW